MNKQKFSTVDDYISSFPEEIQKILQNIRKTIRASAPKAVETISYQMPAFKLNGVLVYFAAQKKHIGFYPTASGVEKFQNELLGNYEFSKGAIRFPIDEPIPIELINRIVEFRVAENTGK